MFNQANLITTLKALSLSAALIIAVLILSILYLCPILRILHLFNCPILWVYFAFRGTVYLMHPLRKFCTPPKIKCTPLVLKCTPRGCIFYGCIELIVNGDVFTTNKIQSNKRFKYPKSSVLQRFSGIWTFWKIYKNIRFTHQIILLLLHPQIKE